MSEQLLLINPRRKRKRTKTRVRRKSRKVARRRKARRSRANLRAPTAKNLKRAYVSGSAPIRRLKINPRRSRRRRLINPRMGLGMIKSTVHSTLVPAGIGALGAAALDLAWGYGSSYLPAQAQSGKVGTLVKLGAAVVIGLGASKVIGRQKAMAGLLCAVTVIGYGALRDLIKDTFPTIKGFGGYADYVDYTPARDYSGMSGVGAYMQPQLGYISPAPVLQQTSSMGAYMSPDLAGYDWRGDGM